jgi:c-di-GMP-binding flagellar brake protein YcgR
MQAEVYAQPGPTEVHTQRRRHVRMPFSVPITLHYLIGGNVRASRGISVDISEGGLGALVPGDLQIGETVEIDLPLQGCALSTVAIVRHCANLRSGFEFLGLTPEERSQIAGAASYA